MVGEVSEVAEFRPLQEARDDVELGADAVRAVQHVGEGVVHLPGGIRRGQRDEVQRGRVGSSRTTTPQLPVEQRELRPTQVGPVQVTVHGLPPFDA